MNNIVGHFGGGGGQNDSAVKPVTLLYAAETALSGLTTQVLDTVIKQTDFVKACMINIH